MIGFMAAFYTTSQQTLMWTIVRGLAENEGCYGEVERVLRRIQRLGGLQLWNTFKTEFCQGIFGRKLHSRVSNSVFSY